MLCRRKIELPTNVPIPLPPLISRDVITDVYKAKHLLNHANTQAEELLSMAEEKCEALQKQSTLEFWGRANTQLARWEREREEMCSNLEQHATLIVNRAIKQLLDETTEPQRLKALLKQLLENQIPKFNATLHCCSDEFEFLKHYFSSHGVSQWTLHPDHAITPQTLILKTEESDFCISWSEMMQTFLNLSSER
ncbi:MULTISPECIES: type III secretion system stator protein SctL [Pseudomonas]|uniref:Type III secretion system stator protein SctL n=1 Tax=Pseudomonas reactans TaxID=117680 RepID=A0A7Y8KHE0_9PSED|nr:type III secretion system stator protein SctL [Pseudomonas reactans]NWE89038.1 type III secretion system stator protein SctL [Pseudomonas reactans]